jgi:predicted dehydrogenase
VEAGFNVICDKPMTFDLAQAEELQKLVESTGVVFAVTHNYTGYPLVRQVREMIQSGELGEIQAVRSNYIQGWLRSGSNKRTRNRPPGEPTRPNQEPPAPSATSAPTPTTSAAT